MTEKHGESAIPYVKTETTPSKFNRVESAKTVESTYKELTTESDKWGKRGTDEWNKNAMEAWMKKLNLSSEQKKAIQEGLKTPEAIKAFQKENKLNNDGIVGGKTILAFAEAYDKKNEADKDPFNGFDALPNKRTTVDAKEMKQDGRKVVDTGKKIIDKVVDTGKNAVAIGKSILTDKSKLAQKEAAKLNIDEQKGIKDVEEQIAQLDKGLGDRVKEYLQASAAVDRADARNSDVSDRTENAINNAKKAAQKGAQATEGFLGSMFAKGVAGVRGFIGKDVKVAQNTADNLWNEAKQATNDSGQSLQTAAAEAVRLGTVWKFDLARGTFNDLTATIQEEIASRIPDTKEKMQERQKLMEQLAALKTKNDSLASK